MRIRVKLWVEHDNEVLFGQGRYRVLKAVADSGSLAAAARDLKMSYRAAWGRIKASEQRLGFPLIDAGGKGRRGATLTPQALKLLQRHADMETHMHDALDREEQKWTELLHELGREV